MRQIFGLNSKLAIRIAACLVLTVLMAACGLLPDKADTGTAQTSAASQASAPEAAEAPSPDQVTSAPAETDSADAATTEQEPQAAEPSPADEQVAGPEPAATEPVAPPQELAAREEPANPPDAKPAPAAAIMDLDGLETRLRKTKAIGLFTKLELKSQVNELLDDVENYHQAKSGMSLNQLEEHFNLLVMKLLVLLENEDPQLHREIARARPVLRPHDLPVGGTWLLVEMAGPTVGDAAVAADQVVGH
ncbi:MAG: hypothetical protein WD645_02610, partial [Dehalococcoidia bacterium]